MAPPSRAERRLGRRWVDPLAACLVAQVAAVVAYTVVPASEGVRQNSYEVIAVSALCLAIWGLRRHRPRHPAGWVMLLAGLAAWIIGELAYGAETTLLGWQGYPLPSDAVFWLGYLLVAAGLLYMVRTRLVGRDFTALLDAAIVAAGAAVVMAVFVIAPLASDTSLSVFGRVVSTSSPVNDILLLAVLVRLWAVPGKANRSCQLLMLSILCTLTSDVAYNVWLIQRIDAYPHILGTGWLLCYSLVAMAMANPGMVVLTEPVPARVGTIPQSRLVALAVALVLPGLALLSSGLLDRPLLWGVIGLGSFVLSAMVLVRMSGLLSQVQDQSEQLAVLARSDGLTGAPNRRTWDFELARAGQEAERGGPAFSVALMDLDHFKRFNDTQGHVVGDELLRNAVMAWSAELAAGQVLARYGGEEFAVLLPGLDAEHAATCIDRLRRVTPCGQTFSAGIAAWRPDIRAEDVLGAADAALYEAKRAGRDRICIDRAAWSSDAVFRPVNLMTPQAENSKPALLTLVLQPIFEIATGRVVGHEALSRFADASDPAEGFRRAHRDGYGDLLEAETIMLALDLPGRPAGQELFVNVSASAIASPRFMPNMPDDLSGVVLELTEDMDEFDWSSFSRALDELRLRGARIAVDDLGSGVGDLVRMAAIRPDIIKIARSIMWRCDRDAGRQALITMLVTYARTQGAQVCAEGVEHEEEYAELRRLGVDLAQGFLLGRPHQHWRASRTDLGAPGSLKRLGGGAALRR